MSSMQNIVAELRSAHEVDDEFMTFFGVVAKYLADTVEMTHYPERWPMDGPIDGAFLAKVGAMTVSDRNSGDVYGKVMPDVRQTVLSFSVAGDAIVMVQRNTGTLLDGTKSNVLGTFVFRFADGRLTHIDIHSDPSEYAAMAKGMAEAGVGGYPGSSQRLPY